MTTPEDANQGFYPTKTLNFVTLGKFDDVLQEHQQLERELKLRYNGKIFVYSLNHPSEDSLGYGSAPSVKRIDEETIICIPEEWHAVLYILCSSIYFDLLEPLSRYVDGEDGEFSISKESRDIVNECLGSVQQFIDHSELKWPDSLPIDNDYSTSGISDLTRLDSLYVISVLFIYLHEVSHIVSDEHLGLNELSPEESKENESRCDLDAARWILEAFPANLHDTCRLGIVIALGAATILTKNSPSLTHPEPQIRASNVFGTLSIEMTDTMKLTHNTICLWTAKILGIPESELSKLVDSKIDVEAIYAKIREALRYNS